MFTFSWALNMAEQPKLVASQPTPQPAHTFDVFVFVRQDNSLRVIHNGEIIAASEAMNRQAEIVRAHIARMNRKLAPLETGAEHLRPVEIVADVDCNESASNEESKG